jgi:hypothetical protein
MINLKLAEYDLETGKFKKFLELGTSFRYGGNYIDFNIIIVEPIESLTDQDKVDRMMPKVSIETGQRYLDKTDPLNRFDGLFDGRTYGTGRFVLIGEYKNDNWQDDIFRLYNFKIDYDEEDVKDGSVKEFSILENCFDGFYVSFYKNDPDYEYLLTTLHEECLKVGNLHENPELWDKIK